jgi:hypothetical protein
MTSENESVRFPMDVLEPNVFVRVDSIIVGIQKVQTKRTRNKRMVAALIIFKTSITHRLTGHDIDLTKNLTMIQ